MDIENIQVITRNNNWRITIADLANLFFYRGQIWNDWNYRQTLLLFISSLPWVYLVLVKSDWIAIFSMNTQFSSGIAEYRRGVQYASFQKLANWILLWFSEMPKFTAKDKGSWQTSRLRKQCGSIKGDSKLNIVLARRHTMSRMGSIRKFLSTFCEEASSCPKRTYACKIVEESISQASRSTAKKEGIRLA